MSLSLLSPSLRVEPAVSLLLPLPLVLAVAEALGPEALGAAGAALPLFPAGFLAGAAAAADFFLLRPLVASLSESDPSPESVVVVFRLCFLAGALAFF